MNRAIGGKWELYVGEGEPAARAKFERKHGYPAAECKTVGEWLYLGPIERGEADDQLADADHSGTIGL